MSLPLEILVEAFVELGDFNAARAFAKHLVVECELRDIDTRSFRTVSASPTLGLVFLLEGRYSDALSRYEWCVETTRSVTQITWFSRFDFETLW